MNAMAILSSKGQLVVPKAIRDRHGWKAGDRIELVETAAGLTLRAAPVPASHTTADTVFAAIDAIVAACRTTPITDAEAGAIAVQSLAERDDTTRSGTV
jgi:AbrB family looped-hinge helix DNA binding protein